MIVDSYDNSYNLVKDINPENDTNYKEMYSKAVNKELTGHKKRVYTLDWNMNGKTLASGSVDTTIRLWGIDSDRGYELKGHSDYVTQVKFSQSEEHTLLSCSSDKTVRLWDTRLNKNTKTEKTKGGCKNLCWNSDSTLFAFSNKDDDIISFYDTRKFQLVKQIEFKNKINEFEFDKTNSIILVGSVTGSLYVLNGTTLDDSPISIIEAHYPPVTTIHVSKTNNIFATGAADALICLWDMKEMISYKVIKKGEIPIRKVQFSYDSKLIASIYEGNNLDIFEVNSGDCVYSMFSDVQQYSIAWNPNNYTLAYCGDDKNRNNIDEGNIHILSIPNN